MHISYHRFLEWQNYTENGILLTSACSRKLYRIRDFEHRAIMHVDITDLVFQRII